MSRVLVIDDEEDVRVATERLLRRDGHELDQAATEAEALEKIALACPSYDVVVTDMVMGQPDSGMKVLQAALSRDLFTEVIVLTDYGNIAAAMECMQRGASDYIDKHIPGVDVYEVLVLKTRQAAQRRRFAIQTLRRREQLVGQEPDEVLIR